MTDTGWLVVLLVFFLAMLTVAVVCDTRTNQPSPTTGKVTHIIIIDASDAED